MFAGTMDVSDADPGTRTMPDAIMGPMRVRALVSA